MNCKENKEHQMEMNNSDDRGRRKSIAAPPPDGGWGWMVVFASFMIHVVADGVAYSFGLFFTKITNSHEMEANKSDASWIGSIMLGITFGAGPLASVLVNKFGCRAVSIAGSFVAAFGFAISNWANTVHFLYVSVGVIGGLGLGLIYLPAIVCVSYYFEKKRAFATGIAVCGSGFGTFALAPVLDLMIRRLGWRGAFLGVAAILLLCVIFAALFRPLPPTIVVSIDEAEFQNPNYELELNYGPQQQQLHSQYDLQMESLQGEGRMMGGNSNNYSNSKIQGPEAGANFKRDPLNLDFEEISLKTEPITRRMASTSSFNSIPGEINGGVKIPDLIPFRNGSQSRKISENQNGGVGGFQNGFGGSCSRSLSDYETSIGNSISNYNCDDLMGGGGGSSDRRSRRDSTSLNNFLEQDSQNQSQSSRLKLQNGGGGRGGSGKNGRRERFSNWMKLLDLSLFQNPIFIFFAFSNFLTNMGTNVPYICYADMARDILNIKDEDDPSLGWLVSSIGISNTVSRFIMGYLSDTKYVNRLYLYSGSLVLCGIATAISAHGQTMGYLVVCALIFGASGGIYVGLTSVILVDLLGLNKLSNSFGIVLFCQGVGTLIGPPIVGLLFDTYKHYLYGFWFAGVCITLSGSMLFFIPFIQRFIDRDGDLDRSSTYQNASSPATRRTSLFSISKD